MKEAFKQYKSAILQIYPQLKEEEWGFIAGHLRLKTYRKKAYFLESGQIQKEIGFLTSGLVRGYYIDDQGEEITIHFAKENGYITHYSAFLSQAPSKYYYQCLEECSVLLLPFTAIQKGYQQHKGLERFGRLIAESILSSQEKRIERFQFQNAEERYLQFVKENPELFNRISLSHLSTYLGIQRPSLSRIRKKIAREGFL